MPSSAGRQPPPLPSTALPYPTSAYPPTSTAIPYPNPNGPNQHIYPTLPTQAQVSDSSS